VHGAGVATGFISDTGRRPAPKRAMKEGIHPNYRDVVFVDIELADGRKLPLFKLETSSESHPFYTGQQKSVDTLGGRVEKFRNKFARVGLKK
jgi:large subunit ribosomal protein L31